MSTEDILPSLLSKAASSSFEIYFPTNHDVGKPDDATRKAGEKMNAEKQDSE